MAAFAASPPSRNENFASLGAKLSFGFVDASEPTDVLVPGQHEKYLYDRKHKENPKAGGRVFGRARLGQQLLAGRPG
jgi:hypothetical protein